MSIFDLFATPSTYLWFAGAAALGLAAFVVLVVKVPLVRRAVPVPWALAAFGVWGIVIGGLTILWMLTSTVRRRAREEALREVAEDQHDPLHGEVQAIRQETRRQVDQIDGAEDRRDRASVRQELRDAIQAREQARSRARRSEQ